MHPKCVLNFFCNIYNIYNHWSSIRLCPHHCLHDVSSLLLGAILIFSFSKKLFTIYFHDKVIYIFVIINSSTHVALWHKSIVDAPSAGCVSTGQAMFWHLQTGDVRNG